MLDGMRASYRKKCARYSSIVPGIVGPAIHDVTIRITPADPA